MNLYKGNSYRLGRKAALLSGAVFALMSTAYAQDTAPQAAGIETTRSTIDGEDAIIVTAPNYVASGSMTATKSAIPLIETPQSVSVITRDQIDLLNFIDAQQAVRYTAGVFGENYGPDLRFDFLTVRGFTPKQYIDGLAAPVSTSILSVGVDLYAFQSFDILKGPASVLYGNSPPGGLYNQTSRRASNEFDGEIGVKYGTDDYKQIAGTVTGPVNDGLSVRFTGLYRDRDAERDNVKAERLFAAPTATWDIGPDTKLTGLLYYQYDKVQGDTNGFLPVYGTLLPNPLGRISRSTNLGDPSNVYQRRQFAAGYDFSHNFGDISFHSNTKWSEYKERTPTGVYGSGGLIDNNFDGVPDDYRTVLQSNFTYKEDVFSFATDNRFEANLNTGAIKHNLIAGIDYRNVYSNAAYAFIFGTGTIDLFNPATTPLSGAGLNPGYPTRFNTQRLKQTGVYAQDHVSIGSLHLTLSGRYDWVKSRYLPPFAAVTVVAPVTDVKQHKFTYRAGANYVFDNGFAPYVSYATSFEPVLGTDSITGDPFKPSSGKQWEGGVKYDARGLGEGIKLFVTAAVFQIKQTNVVSTSPSVSPVFGTQSGEVEVKGGELEFVARIRDQISINGSYCYNHSEVLKSNTAVEVGAPLPTTPKHKASLFVDYTFQKGGLGGLGFGFGGRYTSSSAGSLPGFFNPVVYYGESATLFDAIVHYDTPGWRFAVNGSNIFDKVYVARCSGPAGCTYGAGRQVIGTVTKKF
ncbi:TonB-dependent siderophore receptor [Sphingobium subterraneum]|uniref:Iron complex outermembrane receptor protein n=1 Tax=Sphingobium subterraneum TaxID=627688 RepID=A0A841J048_9SPHN|nr:TonB-dependent siderophore receptor [Sphingobium subterraneum]MBB6123732.1 iron complex outermembrane receptor protein [Sphingobium subterraneum]